MKNIQKTKDWVEMALEDLDAAVVDFAEERYPASLSCTTMYRETAESGFIFFWNNPQKKRIFQLVYWLKTS